MDCKTLCGMFKDDITLTSALSRVLLILSSVLANLFMRNVRYHFWDRLWIQVISQHREEAVHMIQTGLCSRNALCMALVQLSWEGMERLFQSDFLRLKFYTNCRARRMECMEQQQLTFVEHGCYGPGADTSKRVPWMKTLNSTDLEQFTNISFIDNEGWLNAQPF
ncbi:putative pectinesterase 10 [Quercus suber]|uniref:Pectinesterase 10 n=1 Tax=Quercus suber TaxID=58331 RepID=A0AAW0M1T1_QUESU